MEKLFTINKSISLLFFCLSMIFSLDAQNLNQSLYDSTHIRIRGIFEADSQHVVKKEYKNFCLFCNPFPTRSSCIRLFLCESINKESLRSIKQFDNKRKVNNNIMLFSNSYIYMTCIVEDRNSAAVLRRDSIIGRMLWENALKFKDCSLLQLSPIKDTKWDNCHFRDLEYSVLENTHHFLLIEMSLFTFKRTHPYYCSQNEDGILESVHPSDKKKIILLAFPLQEDIYEKYKEYLNLPIISR